MVMPEHFDGWLERELRRRLTPMSTLSPRPAQARYQTAVLNRRYRMLRILPAAAAAKAIAAVAAVAAAGAVTATAVTHSPNPQVWGQQVKAAVEQCKDDLHTGQHGIGDCVSDFASQKGQTERSKHAAHPTGQP